LTTCNEQAMRQRYEIVQPGELFDPVTYRLGAPCKRNHLWDEGVTLRTIKGGHCVLCQRIDALERQARLRAVHPEAFKANTREVTYRHRAKHGRESRSKHGFNHNFLKANGFSNSHASAVAAFLLDGWDTAQIKQRLAIDTALRVLKPSPSVAQLVYSQQLEHWRQCPEDRRKHIIQWSAYYWAFRYMCDPAFRRHECQRNSERKAKNRGNHTVRLNSNAITERFAQFDNSCAYCGSTAHLIVEHFIPRAKGGPHVLGNLLPACQRCNVSKRDHDPEHWYLKQPFYTNARWRKILSALGKAKTQVEQLPLL
jgi:5-methylcytosine-specific restriction endonuclease McrA